MLGKFDMSGWWWMLPLGVGVIWAVDRIGKMGTEVDGLKGDDYYPEDLFDDEDPPSSWQRQSRAAERQMAPQCPKEYEKAAKAVERKRKEPHFFCRDDAALKRAVMQAFGGRCRHARRNLTRAKCTSSSKRNSGKRVAGLGLADKEHARIAEKAYGWASFKAESASVDAWAKRCPKALRDREHAIKHFAFANAHYKSTNIVGDAFFRFKEADEKMKVMEDSINYNCSKR